MVGSISGICCDLRSLGARGDLLAYGLVDCAADPSMRKELTREAYGRTRRTNEAGFLINFLYTAILNVNLQLVFDIRPATLTTTKKNK
jgi:hypothetical protein